jgi:copper resistance protein D
MTMFLFLVVVRWIYFAAICMLFGIPLFWFWEGYSGAAESAPQAFRKSIALMCLMAPIAALSGIAWLAGILANMAGSFADLIDPNTLRLFFFDTQFGGVSFLRFALLALLVILGIMRLSDHLRLLLVLIVAGLLLVTQAWLGHAAEGGAGFYGALMIVIYGIHVLAAAAWVGGLAPLGFVLVEFRPRAAGVQALPIVARYSLLGLGAVTLIVGSGIANAGFRVGSNLGKLYLTPYGTVLGIKLLMVAAMLALAYFNRFIAIPRLHQAAKGTGAAAEESPNIARLRLSIALEFGIGLLVLGAAAVLGITPPPQ